MCHRRIRVPFYWIRAFVLLSALGGHYAESEAQIVTEPVSRGEEIANQQTDKTTALYPDVPDRNERRFIKIHHLVNETLAGTPIHLEFGNSPTGAGFALGPVLEFSNPTDTFRARTWAAASLSGYYTGGAGLELPALAKRRVSLSLNAMHTDLSRLDFYGLGPTSLKSDRTDYGREYTHLDWAAKWKAFSHVDPACSLSQSFERVGGGTSHSVTSTDIKFGPDQAPGIDAKNNFFLAGCLIPFDFRDNPVYPHKGSAVFLGFQHFLAENDNRYSFSRVSQSAEQYIPFLNEKRVIALHEDIELSYHGSNQVVPFYLQPTLGGRFDLRGYRLFRFYDENSLVVNAEYRWEICTGFDMAVFGDSGKVFHRPGDLHDLSNMQTAAGFGLRFNNQKNALMRIDTGFSREGFQVWLSFSKVF